MSNRYERVEIPDKVRELIGDIKLPEGCYIAGGIIYNHYVNDGYKNPDIDVFGNIESLGEFQRLNDNIYMEQSRYNNFFTPYKDTVLSFNSCRPVGSAESVLDDFDFPHCRMLYDGKDGLLVKSDLIDPLTKQILYHGAIWHAENKVLDNVNVLPCTAYNTLKRVFRFMKRGFSITDSGINTIMDGLKSAENVEQVIISFNSLRR